MSAPLEQLWAERERFKDLEALGAGERIEDLPRFLELYPRLVEFLRFLHKDLRPKRALQILDTLQTSSQFHRSRLSSGATDSQNEELRRLEELDGLLKTEEMVLYIDRLKEEVKEIEAFLVECAEPDSEYEVIKQDSEWRTSMKKDMGSSLTKTFRVEGNLKATVPDICAVMSEVDLFPSWVPRWGPLGLQEIKEVVRLTKASAVVYAFLGLPWPLAPRYMNLYAFGCEVLEEDYLVIVMKTVEQFPGYEIPKGSGNGVVGLELTGGCLIKPVSPTQTKVSFLFRTDPKLAYLPYSLINWGMKKFAHFAFTMLGNHAKNLKGTPYERRMETNVELYGDLGSRVTLYFERKEKERTQEEPQKEPQLETPSRELSRWQKLAPWGFI